jgi:hypothetical protein
MTSSSSQSGLRRGRGRVVVLLAGAALGFGATTASAAAVAPTATPHAVVLKHPTCNNDPGFDPSNEPLCAWQHHSRH